LGQATSEIGTWLQAGAVRWFVFDQTGSEFLLGLLEAAWLAPGLLIGFPAGAMADRAKPLRMIVVMECGQMALAFALSLLVGLGLAQVWQLALILALARICLTFELPSRQVLFHQLVGSKDLSNAIALNSGLINASRVIGAGLAGILLSRLGVAGCFAANGASFLVAVVALLSIRLGQEPRARCRSRSNLGEVLGGFDYLFRDRRMLFQFALVTFFGVTAMGYEAMIPAYAKRVVQVGAEGYGILLACIGIGATAGAIAVASLGELRRHDLLAAAGMVVFGATLACAAALPPCLPAGPVRICAAAAMFAGAGLGAVMFYASSMALIQMAAPDGLRGRITGMWLIVYSGSIPLGALWTGRAAQAWGITSVMSCSAALCGAVGLLVCAAGLLRSRLVPVKSRIIASS
jgi:predicted MFS family arabinose efflux permease